MAAEERFFSDLWYRVKPLRPRLQPQLRLERRRGPGGGHYVLFDPVTGRTHRLTLGGAALVAQLDGQTDMDTAWHAAVDRRGPGAPTQEQAVRLLSQLHAADLLLSEIPPDLAELDERRGKRARQLMKQNLMGPLSTRIPLFDPDPLIRATLPLVRPLISWAGLVLWAVLVVVAGLGALREWDALSRAFLDQAWSATSLVYIAGTYVLVKALHELGHGWTARRFGAAVHETGIMLLVFMPVPYVEATEAAALPDRRQRAAVSAAGIIVETALAAAAFLFWRDMEPGPLRAFLFNVMLVGGISTVLVNGNPLLKFDGYFVMTDLLGLPNLAQRANRHWGDMTNARLFGARDVRPQAMDRRDRFAATLYAPAAFAYRIFLSLTISAFVAAQAFVLGVILAIWSLGLSLGRPLAKGAWHVLTAPVLRRTRGRALAITGGGVAVAALALFAVPAPFATVTQGVIWAGPGAELRAGIGGRIAWAVPAGAEVAPGDPVARLEDPLADTRLAALEFRLQEASLALAQEEVRDPMAARLAAVDRDAARRAYAAERDRQAALVLRAERAGRFEPLATADPVGRYAAQGTVLGHVVPDRPERVRFVLTQAAQRVETFGVARVELRLPHAAGTVLGSRLLGAVDSGVRALPSPILALDRGGVVPMVPGQSGPVAAERIFVYDAALPETALATPLGGRVHVKLVHPWHPVGPRVVAAVRRYFLRGFQL